MNRLVDEFMDWIFYFFAFYPKSIHTLGILHYPMVRAFHENVGLLSADGSFVYLYIATRMPT